MSPQRKTAISALDVEFTVEAETDVSLSNKNGEELWKK
jgi:hypothetical protein